MFKLPADLRRIIRGEFGFTFDETMAGEHCFEPGQGPQGRHPFAFLVTWGPERLRPASSGGGGGTLVSRLAGEVTVGGLCHRAPCAGTLRIDYLVSRTIRYEFDFRAAERDYRYVGEKVNIRPWNLPVSHTTCFGTLVSLPDRALVSRSVTHFRVAALPAFLLSFRLRPR